MRAARLRPLLFAGIIFIVAATAISAELPVADFVRHPILTDPAISPDGKYLAVAVSENTDSRDADYQLAVLQLPGLEPVSRLDMAPRYVPLDIHWVSDTRLIMATAKENGTLDKPSRTGDIIAVNYDGTQKRVLYSLDGGERGQVVGTHISVRNFNMSNLPLGVPSIAGITRKPDGHFYLDLQMFVEGSNFTDWDTAESRVYKVDATSGYAEMVGAIPHGGLEFLVRGGIARIAYGQNRQNVDVAFRSDDGKNWIPLPKSAMGDHFEPLRISDDGTRLYALSSLDGSPDVLIECNLDGSDRTVLASDPFSSVSDVMWNPTTDVPVAAVFEAGGKPGVTWIGDSPYVQILQALTNSDPDDFVSLSGASTDGSMLLIHVSGDRNPGVYALFDKAAMHAAPLYQVLPWIPPQQMPRRTPIRFKNRDGVELAGYLTLPVGSDGKHLPLVLIPHGGPIGPSDDWFFDPWAAFLANRGYATLQINYRGSGGRGNAFEDAGFRQFASGIQDDLMDGVKWAISQGYANPAHVCVFGASFGGYSALMQPIVAPDLYKCAIDYAGVYDWRIDFNDSDTRRYEGGRTYFADAIGSEADAYAISPAAMLGKFNVPVLIAHGKDDPRVPYKNATDLRAALDKSGKSYEWLAEPGELHGFYSEKNNEELFDDIEAFLDKHIGSGASTGAK